MENCNLFETLFLCLINFETALFSAIRVQNLLFNSYLLLCISLVNYYHYYSNVTQISFEIYRYTITTWNREDCVNDSSSMTDCNCNVHQVDAEPLVVGHLPRTCLWEVGTLKTFYSSNLMQPALFILYIVTCCTTDYLQQPQFNFFFHFNIHADIWETVLSYDGNFP